MKYLVPIVLVCSFLFACESENVEDLLIEAQEAKNAANPTTNPNDSTAKDTTNMGGLTVSFASQISPLIKSKCATPGCHAGSFSNSPRLETYAQISASKTKVNARVSAGTMPQGGPLPQSEKDLIQTWINEGATNN